MRLGIGLLWLLALVAAYALGIRGGPSDAPAAPRLESSLGERDPARRAFEISRSLRGLREASVAETLRTVEAAGLRFGSQEYRLLMAAWVPIDPVASVDWAFARPGNFAPRARGAAMDTLGLHDPPRARHLIDSLGLTEKTEALHLHMMQGWARSDRKHSLTGYIEAMPAGVPRQHAARILANEILKAGPDALTAWSESIPVDAENQFKRMTFQKAVNAMVHVDPQRASAWVGEHIGERYAAGAPKVVALGWLERDPGATMDWLVALPDGSGGADLVEGSFKRWVEVDFPAAQDWALDRAPGPGVDPAVRVLVRHYFDAQPAQAMRWADRIHKPGLRLRVQASAGRAWHRRDPDGFMAWLPESGLEGQALDMILNIGRQPTGPGKAGEAPAT